MGRGPGREDRRIRALRPPKPPVDPWQPIDVLREEERLPEGGVAPVVTVFLAGAECPFTCVFCDLWRFTTDRPTPEGAIPAQLRQALARTGEMPPEARVKLYNASNFFDRRAVPPDDSEIARLVSSFERVVVECHPKLVGRRCREFAARLGGRLQVAMGLETVHPEASSRLNKRSGPDDFRRAAADLARDGIELRAFVLLGAPFVPAAETLEWAERSVAFAAEQGAVYVSLVPVRGGNGEMERLARLGHFRRPSLEQVEEALDRCLHLAPVVTVDTWDLGGLAACPWCSERRIARLERVHRRGELEPRIACLECGSAAVG